MECDIFFLRNFSLKLLLCKRKTNIHLQLLFLMALILFIHKNAFAQLNLLSEEPLLIRQSLGEKEKIVDWSIALDELKEINDFDKTKNLFTKEMANLLIKVIEYQILSLRALSEVEKKELNNGFEKIYFESIDKIRRDSTDTGDVERLESQLQDHIKILFTKFSIPRIHRVIEIISEIQSAGFYPASLRPELKSLLQQTLDEKGTESNEFQFYKSLLNLNSHTKSILEHNTKEALSKKLEKVQKKFELSKEERRIKRENLSNRLKEMHNNPRFENVDKNNSIFEELEKFSYLKNDVSNFDNYLKFKIKMNSLESRLNSNSEYSFKKNSLPSFDNRLNKDECNQIGFNNIKNMGPDSNQKNTGTCWAHASAALIEEQLCLAHPEHCGKRVARTYIIGKTRGIDFVGDKMSKGANTLSVLSYFVDPHGGNFDVCLDSFSSNPLNLNEFRYPEYLKYEYDLIKNTPPGCSTLRAVTSEELEELMEAWRRLLLFLKDDRDSPSHENHYLNREKFEQLARASRSSEEFIQKVLISSCDHSNQEVSFRRTPEQHLVSIDFNGLDNQKFLNVFKDAKSYNHSVLLSMCFRSFQKELAGNDHVDSRIDQCGYHAVVVNAVQ